MFSSSYRASLQINSHKSEYDGEEGSEKEIQDLRERGVTYKPGSNIAKGNI